jgi:hypothetical protein
MIAKAGPHPAVNEGTAAERNMSAHSTSGRVLIFVLRGYQLFWAAMARREFITDGTVAAGTYRRQGTRWLVAAGVVRPRRGRGMNGRCLTLAQREEIA